VIYYVCHPAHTYTCAVVLLWYGDELRPFFRLVPYGVLHLLHDAAPGTVIWTDFDRLDENQLAQAARIRTQFEGKNLTHLNHPLHSEQRYDMLARLYNEGVNSFGVRRPDHPLDGLRYPVFLRDEVGALSSPPPLLPDRSSLQAAIAALPLARINKPMIVEFGAQPGSDGYYRKFGAYRVGDQIFPQHCFISANWFLKYSDSLLPEHYAEHLAYVADNPHASELRRCFDAAKIDYGRIDYTLVDGRLQIFEINTNPAVLGRPPAPDDGFDQSPYAKRHVEALLALPNATVAATHEKLDASHNWKLEQLRGFYGSPASLAG
jgi:hypothetical protein